ncbi:GntR family transcriptional regulator [Paenibacillus sp. OV219]|uniref:GntR family transcriptional regulator n=1 Tax=Paenibacillus sp. OV219 TaxID=1884377 RepID=UPI0008C3ADCC|nr:GntR family transcriptional regulator [Paenibacillus sp. OV219]SEN98476.1 transcriptional regulator, GntR family [Paenibacillus sp. OV219]
MLKKPTPEPYARTPQTKDVLNKIRTDILLGVLTPDSHIVENQIAAELGVSRGPVRTALQNLEQEGLVRSLPNGRTVVVGFSLKAAEDTFDFRLMLEYKALELIIANEMVDFYPLFSIIEQIREINATIQDGNEPADDWVQAITAVDIQFHRSIMIMSENVPMLQAWNLLASTMYTALTISNRSNFNSFHEYFKDHKAFSDLIIQRNPIVLERIVEHISKAKRLVLDRLKSR